MSPGEVIARAFYRQAQADFETFKRLSEIDSIPLCHRLQFLQMACEKLSKAYLFRSIKADPDKLMSSHAYVGTTLPQIAREIFNRSGAKTHHDSSAVMRK